MPKATEAELQEALKGVAKKSDPEAIYPWGIKIVDFKGKKVIEPLTPDEYRQIYKAETGKEFTGSRPDCYYASGMCYNVSCIKKCYPIFSGTSIICICTD
jgi:hypothetical protein